MSQWNKNILIFCIWILLCEYSVSVHGQTISEIRLNGLDKTDTSYIFSILKQKPGEQYQESSALDDIQALRNIPLFQEVIWAKEVNDGKLILRYEFKERKSILPTFNLGGLSEDSQFWAELGFIDFNAFGTHALFKLVLAYYGKPSFEVFLDRPRWFSDRWGMSVFFNQKNSTEPIYFANGVEQEYDVSKFKFDLATSYFLSNFLRIDIGSAFLKENFIAVDPDFQSSQLPGELDEEKIMFKIRAQWNRMEYHYELQKGSQLDISAEALYPLGNSLASAFYKSELALRKFIRTSKNSYLAVRNKWGISTNNNSPLAAFVKDDYLNIRGVGDRVNRGWAEFTLNVEWRKRLVYQEQYFIQAVLFSDVNGLAFPGTEIQDLWNDEQLDWYGGIGFRLGLNEYFQSIIRLDVSFDLENGQWGSAVFGIGQFF